MSKNSTIPTQAVPTPYLFTVGAPVGREAPAGHFTHLATTLIYSNPLAAITGATLDPHLPDLARRHSTMDRKTALPVKTALLDLLEPLIRDHPFANGLEPEHVRSLAGCARNCSVNTGRYLWRQGEQANLFYLERSGEVALEISVLHQVFPN